MSFLPAFPDINGFGRGYFLAFAPFLFLGVGFWLYETKKIRLSQFIVLIIWVFLNHYYLVYKFVPAAINYHFASLAFLLFTVAWYFRKTFKVVPIVIMLSNLTFSFYLFHNWLFDYFSNFFSKFGYQVGLVNIFSTLSLVMFCFIMHAYLEQPLNRLGKLVTRSL